MLPLVGKFFDSNDREIDRLSSIIIEINSLEEKTKKLKDSDFSKKTEEFRKRLSKGETLDSILPEAFALVREAAFRTLGLRHYDVQLIAATVLSRGKIAEQKTGEGKTMSAVPALYLNALTGKSVHLVTVNDYLARRDAGWMGPIFDLLGMTVSSIISEQAFIYDPKFTQEGGNDPRISHLRPISRKEAYLADVLYGINSEFGFDYLRDNMAQDPESLVQKDFYFAIVDEVDSVLIDEARTPHIISMPDEAPSSKYYEYAKLVEKLSSDTDYQIDEKLRTAHLTDHGITKIEKLFGLSNIYEQDFDTVYHIEAALKARTLFHREQDYIVKDGQVILVDEFTGRLMEGRRLSEGLHQAIEAKEGVPIQRESKTLATVSLQNYFRMYEKLSGMTGTALTEAEEFNKIYKLDVIVIPTHNPILRDDAPGSKTTQIACLMQNKGEIVANDISRTRLFKLRANLKQQKITNVHITNLAGERMWRKYPEYFDKVLVDAPCSMEGRFTTTDPDSYKDWSLKKVKELSHRQQYLLRSALTATKVGGVVVYSTCTLSPEENEGVIDWLLEKEGDSIEVEKIEIPHLKLSPGIKKWGKHDYNPEVAKTARIYPDEDLEGFFIAKIRKIKTTLRPELFSKK